MSTSHLCLTIEYPNGSWIFAVYEAEGLVSRITTLYVHPPARVERLVRMCDCEEESAAVARILRRLSRGSTPIPLSLIVDGLMFVPEE